MLMFLLSPWAMEFVFVILKSIRGFARVEVFAWSGGPRCRWWMDVDGWPNWSRKAGWYTMIYTPKKEATKKNISDIHGPFYPTSTFKTKLWLCFFVDLTSFLMQTLRIWQTPHHLPCLGSYPSCLEVACVLESQERDEQVRWGRQARCGVRETLTFTIFNLLIFPSLI